MRSTRENNRERERQRERSLEERDEESNVPSFTDRVDGGGLVDCVCSRCVTLI